VGSQEREKEVGKKNLHRLLPITNTTISWI